MDAVLDIATSALVAQRANLNVIAGNMANAEVLSNERGEASPYRRRVPLFAPGNPARGDGAPGVHVSKIIEDPTPFKLKYEPDHPLALQDGPNQGYVQYPNVDYHTEMVNALVASRAYEANVTVIEMAKSIARSNLRLLA